MSSAASPSTSPTLLALLGLPDSDAAWATFVELYAPLIEDHCRRAGLNHDDADEVRSRVLSALVTALRDFRYDPARRFRGYLRTTVANAIRRLWRDRERRPGDRASGLEADRDRLNELPAAESVLSLSDKIEEDLYARLRLAQKVIERVRARVKPDVWEAYWLTAIERHPAPVVAERLGKSLGAVYMAKERVGIRLREEGRRLVDGDGDTGSS